MCSASIGVIEFNIWYDDFMIAIVQYRTDESEEHEIKCYKKHLPGVEMEFLSIFSGEIDFENPADLLSKYDKIIIGGSGEILLSENSGKTEFVYNRSVPLLKYVIENDFPTLGVCFGSQLIGKYMGVPVAANRDMGEAGFQTVNITSTGLEDKLFSAIDSPISVAMGHKDSLLTLPRGSKHLAYSDKCQTQAFRIGDNVYGVQFHIELNEQDLQERLALYPHYEALQLGYNAKGAKQGSKILQNFAKFRQSNDA